ncbi:MAG TPA: hypothetical protein VKZ18_07870 [Polyangia bacterium]|nr:hypothetical protein [Polyangia bacterium]
MRPARHRVLVPVAAVAASTVLLSCHRGDSILLVEVAGDLSLTPASLNVTVQPSQAAQRTFMVTPKPGTTITLPASLSVEMAPTLVGPVTVEVDAIQAGFVVATGKTTLNDINVGGETIVAVSLIGGAPPPPVDAGTDASAGTDGATGGTTGSGGAAGTGGATGSGGAVGSGGAAGTGGAAGSAGATGAGGKGGATGSGGATGAGGAAGTGGATGAGGTTDAGGDA